jgi:transcriptional regulator with XRE-family HTH domain
MNIFDRIKLLREERGMTQEQLAEKVGYKSRSTINKIEAGLRDINQSQIADFASALDVTPSYLMGWEDNAHNDNIQTIATHHDGEDWTAEELEEIEAFKQFVKSKRNK